MRLFLVLFNFSREISDSHAAALTQQINPPLIRRWASGS
jgi:hypothetical protein